MQTEMLTEITQLGTAGLVAWMWLTERRAGAARERQLGEAHERLMEQRTHVDALMTLVADNTRAVTAVEASQRSLRELAVEWLRGRGDHGGPPGAHTDGPPRAGVAPPTTGRLPG